MDKTTIEQQAEAMIALHATQGVHTPQGEQPSHEELAMLLDDRLNFNRRKEVLTHLNANTELFAHWVSLVEAKSILSETTKNELSLLQRLQQWLNPTRLGFIGTALAAITTVAIVMPLLDAPATIPQNQPRTTPDYASSADVRIETAVLAGILISYQNYSAAIQQTLPINSILNSHSIPEQSNLAALNPLAIQLGEALLESYRSCQQKDFKSISIQQDRIKQLSIALKLVAWPETEDSATYCQLVDKEINKWIQ